MGASTHLSTGAMTASLSAFIDIKSPQDRGDPSDEEGARPGHMRQLVSSGGAGLGNGVSRAESGQMNYVAHFKKRVRSYQAAGQDSLLGLSSRNLQPAPNRAASNPNRNPISKRPRLVRVGGATGVMSPTSNRVKINVPVKGSDDDENESHSDESGEE
jgi:hypothetical protein